MARTYEVMAAISDESRSFGATERRDYLWRNVSRLAAAAIEDSRGLGLENPFLEQATIYIDDPFYHHGAASVVLELRAHLEDEFTVGVTCLVDHGAVTLRVTRPPQAPKFEAIRHRIDSAGNDARLRTLLSLRHYRQRTHAA